MRIIARNFLLMLPLEQPLQVPCGYLDLPLWRNAHSSIVFVLQDSQALILPLLLVLLLLLLLQWLAVA
jgi:hypothetical protein